MAWVECRSGSGNGNGSAVNVGFENVGASADVLLYWLEDCTNHAQSNGRRQKGM